MNKLRSFTRHDRVLILSPHPDDESLATGGLIQRAVEGGAQVRILYATNGDNNPWPQRVVERKLRISASDRARWGRRRQGEAVEALTHLGVPPGTSTRFLGFPDQGFTKALLELDDRPLNALHSEIANWRPTLLVTPSPFDIHRDHNALAVFIHLALQKIDFPVERLEFFVHTRGANPHPVRTTLRLTQRQQEIKREAILKHHTQMALSKRRFEAYAKTVETFFAPVPPSAELSHYPVFLAELSNGALHLRISTKPNQLKQMRVLLVLESLTEGSLRWSLKLPPRSSLVKVVNAVTEEPLRNASVRVSQKEIDVRIPVAALQPLQCVHLKLATPSLFYDRCGWREVPVSSSSDREGSAQAVEATPRCPS
jgi:LmbE family N-acetylglucosaminyl deacetylase